MQDRLIKGRQQRMQRWHSGARRGGARLPGACERAQDAADDALVPLGFKPERAALLEGEPGAVAVCGPR